MSYYTTMTLSQRGHYGNGVQLIAVTIGLFAIPEIIDLAVQGTSIAHERVASKLSGVMKV